MKQEKYKFFPTGYKVGSVFKDLFAGIIVALVSIPISMGYSQIAGLPMIYGLYGSLLPILIYGLITTSHDFVFGVDAAPAALTGAAITTLGIAPGSGDAMRMVPFITLLVAIWLLIFSIFKAGRLVKYISESVMGGFISGICVEIILMQVPKLYGGTPGTGELPELIKHIYHSFENVNILSLGLSITAISIILLARMFIPKFPMSIFVMVGGGLICYYRDYGAKGVAMLPAVKSGLPKPVVPSIIKGLDYPELFLTTLVIALVITAETLLASKKNAMDDGYKLQPNREILAYSLGNASAAFTGCCPVNGSVSRSSIVRQFGSKSQLTSIVASLSMVAILIFGTPYIKYLPVPVLTSIIVTALMSACEFGLLKRFWHASRSDFYIFLAAFAGVLMLGTIYGVIIGVILSFIAVIIKVVDPPRHFLGVIPGKEGFYDLDRNSAALPIPGVVMYRFSGNLFFANIDKFQDDIEDAIHDDTEVVIVQANGIGNIDITAADRLHTLWKKCKENNIKFFMTEHIGRINDYLRQYGASELITSGAVRRTNSAALRACGLRPPYIRPEDIYETTGSDNLKEVTSFNRGMQAEMEWAFGADADQVKQRITETMIKRLKKTEVTNTTELIQLEKETSWGRLSYMDEDEILENLEETLPDIDMSFASSEETLLDIIHERREAIEQHARELNHETLERLHEQREKIHQLIEENKMKD